MKKTTVTILSILFLAVTIGIFWLGSGLFISIHDEREERPPRFEPGEVALSIDHAGAFDGIDSLMIGFSRNEFESFETYAAMVLGVSVPGEKSSIHFVRSMDVIGEQPSRKEREAFATASSSVLEALTPGAILLDLDAVGMNNAHPLLFGREGLDVTSSVKIVYDALILGGGLGSTVSLRIPEF